MSIGIMTIFFFVVLVLALSFLSLMQMNRIEKGIDFGNKAGLAVIFSVFLGWCLAQVVTTNGILLNNTFILGMFPFALAALSLSLYAVKQNAINRFWIILAVTGLSVIFLPENLVVFQGAIPFTLDRVLTAILWAIFVNAYTTMNKIEGLTFIQTSALSLAFLFMPYIAVDSARQAVFSISFLPYPLFILSSLIGFALFHRYAIDMQLGKTAAIPLGYLMGLFLVLLTAKGWIYAPLIMPVYYYFEIIYSRINCWAHRKNPEPKKFTFFISYVFRRNLGSHRVYPFLFMVMLGFALIGILYGRTANPGMTLTACVLCCTIYLLPRRNDESITYRAMFRNVKDLGIQVKNNFTESIHQITPDDKKKK